MTAPIAAAVAGLDAWLDTVRGPDGYGGPVAHWWQQSLIYTGAGCDWRYEGIIAGYLTLWERTAEPRWLDKARRAGDDLVRRQSPDGHYPASGFEANLATAGTPHEAACDLGLLLLAAALQQRADPDWQRYAAVAERNLQRLYLSQLWDRERGWLLDDVVGGSFVPNKAATAAEALLRLAQLRGDERWADYAWPSLHAILAHQVAGGAHDGAIDQVSFRGRMSGKYIPVYVARCVPALVQAHTLSGEARWLASAARAMRWVAGLVRDGQLPTVVYAQGRPAWSPSWVAPLGDVLRAASLLAPYGWSEPLGSLQARLLAGQDASGGIQTATGFAGQAGGRRGPLPDLRDVLHVAGWCDKAWRYLTTLTDGPLPAATSAAYQANIVFRGQQYRFEETTAAVTVTRRSAVAYQWDKGRDWATVAAPAFWLR